MGRCKTPPNIARALWRLVEVASFSLVGGQTAQQQIGVGYTWAVKVQLTGAGVRCTALLSACNTCTGGPQTTSIMRTCKVA
jgi:hypothetical protein